MPIINSKGRVVLKNARHPLIEPEKVVPISLTLGTDYNTLIITGPNTGGKTVTLKTIGLLTLMTMCGLMVPCDDFSEICVFDKILVDIGDEQSIEQSLSTFSSHMVNIASVLENATPFSLVLLDELGAGTDPIEGAALARAILCRLAAKGCKTVSTTHYAELKTYAIDTPLVENACCEFDVETLQPTYNLLIGVPGRSNAFAISEKLGIEKSIINEAKSYISEENLRLEGVISSLEAERQKATAEKKKIQQLREELSNAKLKADELRANITSERDRILEKARQDAEYIIENTRHKSNELLNELDDMRRKASKNNNFYAVSEASRVAKRTLNDMHSLANPVVTDKSDYALPRPLVLGDIVRVSDIGKDGTVIEIKENMIRVNAGSIKIWTDVKNIILIDSKSPKNNKTHLVTGIRSGVDRVPLTDFDMRGMSVDEGMIELDRFIDNAVMTGLNSITIIHGKGTGVLRKAVHTHLRQHKSIKSFRIGLFGEGENGVTIAEIKR